jgi:hypothetical protein
LAFDLPASQALVPELVDRDQIAPAVQLNQAMFHGSRLIGPAVAGWLIGKYGIFSAFIANAVTFIPVIVTLLIIRAIRHPDRPATGTALASIREGFSYVRERPRLRGLISLTALTTLLVFPEHGCADAVLREERAAPGRAGGGLDDVRLRRRGAAGSPVAAGGAGEPAHAEDRVGHRGHRAGDGGAVGLPAWRLTAWHGLPVHLGVALLGTFVVSISFSSAMGLVATILQQTVPDELRGRVMSLQTLVWVGILPLAALIVTRVVDLVTMPVEILGAGGLYLVGGFFLLRMISRPESLPAQIGEAVEPAASSDG